MKLIPVGKYKGKSFAEIAIRDPRYLDWVVLNFEGEIRVAASNALSDLKRVEILMHGQHGKLPTSKARRGRQHRPHSGGHLRKGGPHPMDDR